MLISFSVENFRSIRERQTLSMEAVESDKRLEGTRILAGERKPRLLRSAVIYGANASGKSNVIKAMRLARDLVLQARPQARITDNLPIEPFLLRTDFLDKPMECEWRLRVAEYDYRYGFRVSKTAVTAEWLYRKGSAGREAQLFLRNETIECNPQLFSEGKGLVDFVRQNRLFLSVCGEFNGKFSSLILNSLSAILILDGPKLSEQVGITGTESENLHVQQELTALIPSVDVGIESIKLRREERRKPHAPSDIDDHIFLKAMRPVYDEDGIRQGLAEFDIDQFESEGTKKIISCFGVFSEYAKKDYLIVVDEFESNMHPLLSRGLLDWLHTASVDTQAQFVLATQDAQLMDPDLLRRDQIWFCEKDRQGATSLYSLAEFDSNEVRPTSKFSKAYLLGLFGAVPHIKLEAARQLEVMTNEKN